MARKSKPKKYREPSIINTQIVLSMAILMLLLAGMVAVTQNQSNTQTQIRASSTLGQ